MGERLSKNQRRVLEMVANQCQPSIGVFEAGDGKIIPLYIGHLPTAIFDSHSHRERFVKNLEARGLLRYERETFLYITDKGRQAVTSNEHSSPAAEGSPSGARG